MSNAMTIVPMTTAHIELLMPHEREMFGAEAWTARGYRDELADTQNRHYLAVEGPNGELLGWAGVLVVTGSAEILTVGVVPSARRQGLAHRMLEVLYAEAITRGATELFLEVRVDNESARKLYEKEGFADLGRRRGYYGNGTIDAVVMRREL
jgi:[ribosomal protein S18]-alanine N-acetyltransferase